MTRQLQIDYQGGLTQQFPEFRDVVRASVYACGRPFKAVAADLDMSVSELSRKLADNPADPVHFPLTKLPELLAATGDLRPVYWLIERFMEDPDARRSRILAEASAAMKLLQSLIPQMDEPTLKVAK